MPQYHGVVFRSTNEIDYHQRPGGRGKLLDGSSSLTQTSWGKQPGVRYNDPTWQTAVHLSVSKQCEDYNDPYVAIVPQTPNMVIGGTKRARSEDEDEMMERPVRAKSRRLWQQYGEKNVHLVNASSTAATYDLPLYVRWLFVLSLSLCVSVSPCNLTALFGSLLGHLSHRA